MASVSDLYSLYQPSKLGIEGYHVQKKYIDPVKIKEQRELSTSKSKTSSKPLNVSKKTTFIDDVQKKSAKLPGPSTYESSPKQRSRAASEIIKFADRKTFVDELLNYQKKKHVPGAGAYGRIQTETDKSKLKPNIRRAESPTFAEGCMREALETPGVGNYNSHHSQLKNRCIKWIKDQNQKKNKDSEKVRLPSVGTYNPDPVAFSLFSSISDPKKGKKSFGMGGKSQRFKPSKQKKTPFHSVISEWGIKNKIVKKDILCKISSNPASSRSVYY